MAARLQMMHSLPPVWAVLMVVISNISAQSDSSITVLVRSPVATSSEATNIIVYREDVQRSVTFDKARLKGSGVDSQYLQFRNNNLRVPSEAIIDHNNEPATLMLPDNMTTVERTGIYSITVTGDDGTETVLRVLITCEDADVTAAEYSTVVSQGDNVTLRAVLGDGVDESSLRWRRDGDFQFHEGYGAASFSVFTARNSEVLECFVAGTYAGNRHAIMNLIVRGCPDSKTGPGCMDECPRCFNGGVCSDKTTSCICPPGFSGDHCQNIHGSNVFGQNIEYKCNDSADDHGDGCKGAIICYPEPFGCICPAGYTGIDCMQECTDGKFGANCKQDCHCQDGVSCTKDTGECPNNQCAEGWKGINCQVEDPCAAPWIGEACDEHSGVGMILDVTYIKVNPGVSTNVTCSAIRNPVLGENDLELMPTAAFTFSVSDVDGETFTRSNTWMVTLHSDPALMASCTIGGTTLSQSLELVPYELLQYSDGRMSLLSFSAVTSTSMVVAWPFWDPSMDVGDGPIKEYLIEYREGGSFTQAVRTSTGSSHEVTNLKTDTLYELRIVLVREGPNGDGPPSDIQSQRTLCGSFTMSPSFTLESINARTATFRIEIPPSNHWSCRSITATLQRQQSDGQWIEEMNLATVSGTVDVRNLLPCSRYNFRVQLDNGQTTITSQSLEITSQPEALVVMGLTVSAATTGQLIVSWQPPDPSQTNCTVNMYTVMYRLVRHLACTSDVTESTFVTETTESTSITLDNLNDYAEYDVIVRADGEVAGTEVREVGTTLRAAPSAPPMNISVEIISSTSLAFTWEPLPCDQYNGDTEAYRYSLRLANGSTVEEGSTESVGIVINGLTQYVNYLFTVRAVSSAGPGPESRPVTSRTDTESLPQLAPPQVLFSNATVIQIVWQTPDVPPHIVIAYTISVQLIGDGESTSPDVISVETATVGEPPSYILTGLNPFSNYSIMVLVVTTTGSSEWSLARIVATKRGTPGQAENVVVTRRTQTELTVEWDAPSNSRGQVIKYEIRFQAVERPYVLTFTAENYSRSIEIVDVNEHNIYIITSLEPSTVYNIEVSAYNSVGQGQPVVIIESTEITSELNPVDLNDIGKPERLESSVVITIPPLVDQYATGYVVRVKRTPTMKRAVTGYVGGFEENPDDYITAEINKTEHEIKFTIGDGLTYGTYKNVPLQKDKRYEVFVGTESRVGENGNVAWSEAIIIEEFSSSLAGLVIVLAVLLVVAVILCLVITMVMMRRKTRAKKNRDVAVHEYAETDKPNDALSLRQKPHKLNADSESEHYEETEQNPYEKTDIFEEPSYLKPSPSKIKYNQLEKESQLYTEAAPALNNIEVAKGKTGENGLNSDDYEETDIRTSTDSSKTLPDRNKKRGTLPAPPPTYDVDPSCMRGNETYEELPDLASSRAKVDGCCSIKIKDLPDLLQNKDMDPEATLRDEFLKLHQGKQLPWTAGALKDENFSGGKLPYDHSSINLQKNSSGSNFDNYNANFIKDQHNEKSFIAAHGPTSTTVENFWRMVWEYNVQLIVNLSELTETACQYWPSGIETIKKYGDFTVIWCDNVADCCDFSIREMKIIKGDKIHEIKLCHFLSWPENCFPHQPAVVLDFIKKVKTFRTKRSPPVLVHCSNGVGATGAFIAIYCLLEGLRNKKKNLTADVFEFVTKMRKNRADMVQNESQYTFVFEALTTALVTPENVLSADRLLEMDLNLQKDVLVQEYQVMKALCKVMTPRTSKVGQSQENTSKNRFPAVLPLDSCRVVLKSPGCSVGSNDYINGSLVNSPYLRDGFIMTQAPLETTVSDFWKMIYDYDCAAIVSLNEMDENDEEVYFYWPEGGKVQYGNMSVQCVNAVNHNGAYIERHLLVKRRKFQKEVTVRHYQLLVWPEQIHQSDALVEIIFKVQPLVESKQRIVAHCLDGVRRSGIFLTVMTEMLHLKTCKEVELFQTIHNMKGKNPHMVTELEDYLLCYQLLKSSLMVEESAYANVGE